MAKDPAINWYFDNWAGGTKGMTRHQKGCYMDLLEAQFYLGPLSLEQVKNILGSDFNQWNFLSRKFETNQNGELFFNERLEAEKEKRRRYSESRKNGKAGRKKSHDLSHDNHMNNHTVITPGIGIETGTEKKDDGMEEGMDVDLLVEKIILDKHYREQCEIAGYPPSKLDRWMEAFNRFLKFKGVTRSTEVRWRLGFPAWMAYHNYRNGEDPDAYNPVIWARQKKEDADKILKENGAKKSNSNGTATSRSVASLLSGSDGGLTDSEDVDR